MPCVKSGARAGSLYRNLVAHALTLGASGDRAPVRQQPCTYFCVIFPLKLYIHLTKTDHLWVEFLRLTQPEELEICLINTSSIELQESLFSRGE